MVRKKGARGRMTRRISKEEGVKSRTPRNNLKEGVRRRTGKEGRKEGKKEGRKEGRKLS